MKTITIAIDGMGGDNAPAAVVEGALNAARAHENARLLLVGRKDEIDGEILKHGSNPRVTVLHAEEVIGMDESPTTAIRKKKNSSMVVGLNCVKEKEADAFVSAGNTGALLTGATVIIGRSEGIERPALGTMLPNTKGFTLLIDSGANMDAKPSYLAQFAVIGSEYVRKTTGIAQPRVGLINVGAEKEKGNSLVKEAYALLEALPDINFIGNVEAREVPHGAADVAVCDAFVGNVVLKYTEGFAKALMEIIKDELTAGTVTKIGALLAKPAFKRLKKRFDHREVGCAPFLGLKALVAKAHGSSDAYAITNAINQCINFAEKA
ncbi:MAG: phosphate acyltransferase PlsX [Clostridiales bacterium]|jgi:glycerol-3-phosphate acyltransferase PlsX|nr:phosphate acyltransferase PlsX [Clostridiales bacterium]